jgi:catechol 2,3-dioxygenase-like lactoylglutathione lyase family enzyme
MARPQGLAGVASADLLSELHRQNDQTEALLLGRQTFEDFRGYWPTQTNDTTASYRPPSASPHDPVWPRIAEPLGKVGVFRTGKRCALQRCVEAPRDNRSVRIERLDHLVLTVAEIDRTVDFYERVLGMTPVTFGRGRHALSFGNQKINLHLAGAEFEPKAHSPTPGSADLCFIASVDLDEVREHLDEVGVLIEQGPLDRTGALGPIRSIYFRDPDMNLIEVSVYSDRAS